MKSSEKNKAKKLIIEELAVTPIFSIACKKAGIPKATSYRWRKDDPTFDVQCIHARTMGIDNINELAESSLIKNIRNGDFRSTKFWLETNHNSYRNKREESYDAGKMLDEYGEKIRQLLEMIRSLSIEKDELEKQKVLFEKERQTFISSKNN